MNVVRLEQPPIEEDDQERRNKQLLYLSRELGGSALSYRPEKPIGGFAADIPEDLSVQEIDEIISEVYVHYSESDRLLHQARTRRTVARRIARELLTEESQHSGSQSQNAMLLYLAIHKPLWPIENGQYIKELSMRISDNKSLHLE